MRLTRWERLFLEYYMNKFNAKYMRVWNNKHVFFATRVDLYTVYKRLLKHQPPTDEETFTTMFKNLNEGEWYFIPSLLSNDKED